MEQQDTEPNYGDIELRIAIVIAVLLAASSGAAPAQDAERGKTLFRKCVLCHSVGDSAQNKVGPELNGLDGRRAGSVEGYPYSNAHAHSAITWNKNIFNQYIRDPQTIIPGTKKVFAGVKDQQETEDLWAYIKQFAADGSIKK